MTGPVTQLHPTPPWHGPAALEPLHQMPPGPDQTAWRHKNDSAVPDGCVIDTTAVCTPGGFDSWSGLEAATIATPGGRGASLAVNADSAGS